MDTKCKDFYIDHKTGVCEALGRVPTEADCKKCNCPTKELPVSLPAGHREGRYF